MAKRYDEIVRKKKIYRAKHNKPKGFKLGFILLPIGYMYNREWQEAKKGDTIRFMDGDDATIFCVRVLKMDHMADILCRMRYGITLKGALARWHSNVRLEGESAKVISTDECLMVVYGEETEDYDIG